MFLQMHRVLLAQTFEETDVMVVVEYVLTNHVVFFQRNRVGVGSQQWG